ncbi:hypothetical protein HS1genome_1210 [Sulfodiicoccus acidiphilus]|uniref:Uncharacterized protein n=1 Tax=Sulfodiicoccus acidiphilus TaxID=1670455 RepID=A0A348B3R9_9CREN|nr:hypothetical protein HS1genome_1210 [Sulfodiicoccus acidiphilus]GGU04223.1 hypothetical protein GCM10007116_21150 [Sulfodiicoccus acidiphilus]
MERYRVTVGREAPIVMKPKASCRPTSLEVTLSRPKSLAALVASARRLEDLAR